VGMFHALSSSPAPWEALAPLRREFARARDLYEEALEGFAALGQRERDELRDARLRLGDADAELKARGGLIHELNARIESLGVAHEQLRKEHGELAAWGQAQDAEVSRLRGLVADARASHDEAVAWARSLDGELA